MLIELTKSITKFQENVLDFSFVLPELPKYDILYYDTVHFTLTSFLHDWNPATSLCPRTQLRLSYYTNTITFADIRDEQLSKMILHVINTESAIYEPLFDYILELLPSEYILNIKLQNLIQGIYPL